MLAAKPSQHVCGAPGAARLPGESPGSATAHQESNDHGKAAEAHQCWHRPPGLDIMILLSDSARACKRAAEPFAAKGMLG